MNEEKYTDQTVMDFGKYAGQKLANVPASYLLWLEGQIKEKPATGPLGRKQRKLLDYIQDNRQSLNHENKRR